MKAWMAKALELLKATLEPPKHELNELDWKAALPPDKKRLTEHLSALSNQPGGGYLVFGVDASGSPAGLDEKTVETTVNHLANLGRAGLEPPVALDHAMEDYESVRLLFVHVPESPVKPVHRRGKGLEDAYIRSGVTTRKASRQEIGTLMLNSRTPRWEELHASVLLQDTEFADKLDVAPIFLMLERPGPTKSAEALTWMEDYRERINLYARFAEPASRCLPAIRQFPAPFRGESPAPSGFRFSAAGQPLWRLRARPCRSS